MTEAKRKQLKQKVAAGEKRNEDRGRTTIFDRAGERAIEAKDQFTAFAKEHPFATVAGGLAIGILISSLFKRSPTRRLASKGAGLAAIGAELALAYAQQAMEAANEAGRAAAPRIEKLGESLGSSARSTGRAAAERASDLGETARAVTRDASKRIGKALRSRIN